MNYQTILILKMYVVSSVPFATIYCGLWINSAACCGKFAFFLNLWYYIITYFGIYF